MHHFESNRCLVKNCYLSLAKSAKDEDARHKYYMTAERDFLACQEPQIEFYSPEFARLFTGKTAVVINQKYATISDWEREKNSYLKLNHPHLYRMDILSTPIMISGGVVGALGALAWFLSSLSCWEGDANCRTVINPIYGSQIFDNMNISDAHKLANERVLPGIAITGAALLGIGVALMLPTSVHKGYQKKKLEPPLAMYTYWGLGRIAN